MKKPLTTSAGIRFVQVTCVLVVLTFSGLACTTELLPRHFGIFVVTGHQLKELPASATQISMNNRGERVLSLVGKPSAKLLTVDSVLTYGAYKHVAIWSMERVGTKYRLVIDSNDTLPFLYLDEAPVQHHEQLTRYIPKVPLRGGRMYVLTATTSGRAARTSYYAFLIEEHSETEPPSAGAVKGTWAMVPPSSSLRAPLPNIMLKLKTHGEFEMVAPSYRIDGSYTLKGTTLILKPTRVNGQRTSGTDANPFMGTFFGRKCQWLELNQMPGAVFARTGQPVAARQ